MSLCNSVAHWCVFNSSLLDTVSHVNTHTHTQRCVGELTHRTCRATAPSVLSSFVNRSDGNSCRAVRDRHVWLRQFIYSMWMCVRVCVCFCRQYKETHAQQKAKRPMCTDKEPCPESPPSKCVWQSDCALPRTVYEHASSESDKKRRRKWKKWTLGGQSEGKEEREIFKNRARDI